MRDKQHIRKCRDGHPENELEKIGEKTYRCKRCDAVIFKG